MKISQSSEMAKQLKYKNDKCKLMNLEKQRKKKTKAKRAAKLSKE